MNKTIVMNHFSDKNGKVQRLCKILYKSKFAGEWYCMVKWLYSDYSQFMPVEDIEYLAVVKLDLRKIETLRG